MLEAFQNYHVEWGPTLAVFNDVKEMYAFKEKLCTAGVRADCVQGTTPSQQRQRITDLMEIYMLDVICVCKCWNEGKDIPVLRTVVFCDQRDSDINKRQLAQRAGRLHECKPYYNIVIFVQKEVDDDIAGLLRSFCDDDPLLRDSAHAAFGGERTALMNSRITVSHASGDAELVSDTVVTRLGEILVRRDHKQEKIDALIALGRRPKKGERLWQFIRHIKGNWTSRTCTKLSSEQIASLEASWFKAIIDTWTNDKSNLSFKEKLKIVRNLASKPARSEHAHGFAIGQFVADALRVNGQYGYRPLKQVKWFIEALGALQCKRDDEPDMKTKLQWLKDHGRAPRCQETIAKTFNDKPYQFNIGKFWNSALQRAAAGKASEEQTTILQGQQWYEDAVSKHKDEPDRKTKLQWLKEFGKVPQKNDTVPKTYNDKPYTFRIGDFWANAKRQAEAGKASDDQVEILEGQKWYDDAVSQFKEKRKQNTLGPVPLATKIDWLCELSEKPPQKEVITKTFKDKAGPWK